MTARASSRTPVNTPWPQRALRDVSLLIKDGTHGSHERIVGGVLLLSAVNVRDGAIDWGEDVSAISEADYRAIHSNYELKPNDLLLTVVGTLGRRVLLREGPRFTIQRSVAVIRSDPTVLYPPFLYQLTGGRDFQSQLGIRSNSTAQAGIYLGELGSIPVAIPRLAEQKKIAEILGSVDEAIQATQAVIDQTRKVKQGLLQQLITRGIGHTRFKQTEIGQIPESWDVVSLESLLSTCQHAIRSGPFGSALLKQELVESGIPFLGIDNVFCEEFRQQFKRFVTPEKFQELSRYAVRERDVMITIMGTVGRCCVVPQGVGPALSSKHVWTMTFDQRRCYPELICWQLNYAPWVLSQFTRTSQGGTMPAINSAVLKSLLVPLPSWREQGTIFDLWHEFNSTLLHLEGQRAALEQAKRGLMQDLLTGRVRVAA